MNQLINYRAKINRSLLILGAGITLYIIAMLQNLSFRSIEGIGLLAIFTLICLWDANTRKITPSTIAVLDRLNQGITITDKKREIVYVNPAFAKMLNTTPDTLIGKTPLDITAPNHHPILYEAHAQRKLGNSNDYEITLQFDENPPIPVLVSGAPSSNNNKFDGALAVITDLRPLKETEHALQITEKRYRDLVELSPDMILVHVQGKVRFINKAGAKMLGAESPESLIDEPVMQFVPPEMVDIIRTRMKAVLQEKQTLSALEEVFLQLDGTPFEVEVVAMPFDYDGELGIKLIARDITDRKQAERERTNQNRFFQQMLDALGQGVVVTGKGGEIEIANPAYTEMLRYDGDELIGKKLADTTVKEDRGILQEAYLKRKSNLMTTYEARLRRKDDSILHALITATPRIQNDSIIGAFYVITDLTERKKIEETLRRNQAEKQAILDAIPDMIFIKNAEGIYVDYVANDNHLFFPPEEFIGKAITDLFPEPLSTLFMTYHQQAIATGDIQMFEYELSRANKKDKRFYEARALAYNEDRVLYIIREITEQKQAESARLEQAEQYQKLFENSNDAIYLIHDGRFELVNHKFTQLTGVTQEEAPTININDIISPKSREDVAKRRKQHEIENTLSDRYEFIAAHKNGDEFEVEVSISAIPYKGGTAIQGIARDISTRKRHEKALRNSEKRYRDLVEHNIIGIFITVDRIVQFANPAMAEILGANSVDELIGIDNLSFVHEDYHDIVSSRREHILTKNEKAPLLYEKYVRLDGTIIDVEVSAIPIDYEEQPAIQIVVRDISVQKQAEKTLHQNQNVAENFLKQLKRLNHVNVELAKTETFDDFCYHAIELGHEQLDFDRLSLSLFDPKNPDYIVGTFGTDEQGNIRDERHIRYKTDPVDNNIDTTWKSSGVEYRADTALLNHKSEQVGKGWHGRVLLRDGNTLLGWLNTDNLFSQAPPSQYELELLMLYGATISSLIVRKRAEQKLRRSLSDLQAIFNSVAESICVTDLDGNIQSYNAHSATGAKQLTGKIMVRDQKYTKYLNPQFHDEFKNSLKKTANGKTVKTIRQYKGAWYEINYTPVYNGDIIEGVCISSIDITEHKRAEENIRASEARFRAIFEATNIGIVLADEKGYAINANTAFCEMLGYSQDELKTMSFAEYTYPDDFGKNDTLFQDLLQNKRTQYHLEKRYVRKDGELVWVNLNVSQFPTIQGEEVMVIALVEDITERKETQNELRHSANTLQTIFNSIVESLYLLDLDGILQAHNRNLIHYATNTLKKDGVGTKFQDYLAPELHAAFKNHMNKVKRGEPVLVERNFNNQWFETNYNPVFDGDKVTGVCISSRNISARKLMAESESALKTTFNAVNEAIVLIDRDGYIKTFNELASKTLEFVAGQAVYEDAPIHDYILQENRARFDDHFKRALSGETIVAEGEVQDGEWYEVRYNPVYQGDEITGVCFTTINITERKSAAQKLAESESTLQTLLDSVRESIYLIELDGTVRKVNKVAYDIALQASGIKLENGVNYKDYLHPSLHKNFDEHIETIRKGEISRVDRHYEGEWHTILYYPVIENGEVTGACITAFDVTERKRWELELEEKVRERTAELEQQSRNLEIANERLTELDTLKNKFIADVSHELRTPLTVLHTRAYLLEHSPPEKIPQFVAGLKSQIERMTEFTETVLDLSRIEMNKTQSQRKLEVVDFNAVVDDIKTALSPRADVVGLDLHVHLHPTALSVRGEYNQLAQIATNFISNAIKYTPEGMINVSTKPDPDTNMVIFTVSDTGMGIPEDEQTRLFDRFYRGVRAGQSTIPGTGLGLSIAHELIELYGGHIEVDSVVDEGSTFRIYLPLIDNP